MNVRRLFLSLLFAVTASGLPMITPVSAHHSTAGSYDVSQRLSFTGTVKSIDWRQPHMSISVEVVGERGDPETWEFEGPPPGWMDRESLDATIEKTVKIEASPAWDEPRSAVIRAIELPDGTRFSLCPQSC